MAPVDFERQTLREGLETAGFDFERAAVFSWIGVTMNLTLDAINATLATIGQCVPGTRIALTYNQPLVVLDDFAAEVTAAFAAVATEMGEPFVSLFVLDEIDQLLREHGFGQIVHFGRQEAAATYFSGRTDVQIAGAQRLAAATHQLESWPRLFTRSADRPQRREQGRHQRPEPIEVDIGMVLESQHAALAE